METTSPYSATPRKPTIKVMLRNVYGEEKIYPACGKAEVFTELLGQKTLTYKQIDLIKALGVHRGNSYVP